MEHESRANNPAFVLYRPATRPPALVFSHAAGGIAAGSQRLTLFPTIAQKTAREVEREGATPAVGSAQLNSAASPATATIAETAPASSLAPKRKQAEETFYITKTRARYHRSTCHHLRRSAYPITRAEAEACGYTPCRVCYQ
jgi:hypothetical protein